MKNKHSLLQRISLKSVGIVLLSSCAAFLVGIQTAGDVHPVVDSTSADSAVVSGDLSGNARVDVTDARLALEIAQGYRSPEPGELAADPNGDFHITVEDAMAILEQLELSEPSL